MTRKHPTHTSDFPQVTGRTGEDDYSERLSENEWSDIFAFFRKFETIRRYFDYFDFIVGGERRRLWLNSPLGRERQARLRGIGFHAPRHSLCTAVSHGYFDDLMIGNFMKTELHNATFYPHFTPLVCKLGGSAKVFTNAEWRAFRWHYFWRNPWGSLDWRAREAIERLIDLTRRVAAPAGIKRPLKWLYRKWLGDPVTRGEYRG